MTVPPPAEIVVPWGEPSQRLVTQVRSTLLASSVATLRRRGHYERYLPLLPARHHEAVLFTLAPAWLDLEHAMAHYSACDALGLSKEEMVNIGNAVGEQIQGTFLGALVKTARSLGANPWIALGQFNRLYERLLRGGGVQISKLAMKDARIDLRNLPLLRFEYFRVAFLGVIRAAADLFAHKSFTREIPGTATDTSVSYFHAWA